MTDTSQDGGPSGGLNRRAALAKLGLAATAAYVAPSVLLLERNAHAVQPSCNRGGKGTPWCGKGGKSSKGGK